LFAWPARGKYGRSKLALLLQAGVLPVKAGFQVSEAPIDMCCEPGSHLLNQIRGRIEAPIHLRLTRIKAPGKSARRGRRRARPLDGLGSPPPRILAA